MSRKHFIRGIYDRCLAILGIAILVTACKSAPRPIPFTQTRALVAESPRLAAIERQIAARKVEQDALDQKYREMAEQAETLPADEGIKKREKHAMKERELCEAELALLINQHQLEAAKLLKRPDIAEREKIVADSESTVANKRRELAEAK